MIDRPSGLELRGCRHQDYSFGRYRRAVTPVRPKPVRSKPVRSKPVRSISVALGVLALGVAGCSNTQSAANREPHTGSAAATVVDGVQQVTLTVGPTFRFAPSTITVHRGQVKITLHHLATGAPHDWQLTGFPMAQIPILSDNQSQSVTFMAPAPGKYQFVCSIHLNQGQTGTMIVLPN